MLEQKVTRMSDESKRWSVSVEKDGVSETTEVREVENGFIVRKSKYGHVGDDYIDENKEWISKTNPLDDSEKEEDSETIAGAKDLLNSLSGSGITL